METLKEHRLYQINYHAANNILELKWLAETANMLDQDFLDTLDVFSDLAIKKKTPFLLIDTHQFRHQFTDVQTTMSLRAQNIIPKYVQAGVRKEAFFNPEGAPPIKGDYGEMVSDSFHSMDEIRNWFASQS